MINTLLVANRGEIARRIFRTAHEMGMRTVAVYSDPDRNSPHVAEADVAIALGGASASESYLDGAKILAAAAAAGADAIHPGYGFLSESAEFAASVVDAGLTWVGPAPSVIAAMGSKIEAKARAASAGVPTLPSAKIEGTAVKDWAEAAEIVGYPLIVKASAGGGGRGMRIVGGPDRVGGSNNSVSLAEAIEGARREAASSFGDGTVFIERYLAAARHIEIQVFADTRGTVLHLGERECSIQRRHQKIIEESPSTVVDADLRRRMGEAAVSLVRSIGYVGAGTVEFLVDDTTREFFFLEMNTRLQVEHPVTEAICGVDLVRWQLSVAQGERLPITQHQVRFDGHAIEARLYAEEPSKGFLPAYGTLISYARGSTAGVRHDDGVASGSEVSTYYDPMLAKVIAHAPSRAEATARLRRSLQEMAIHGVATNRDYLVAVLAHEDFASGRTTTAFVDEHHGLLAAGSSQALVRRALIAAALADAHRRRLDDRVWGFAPSGWRNVASQRQVISYRCGDDAHRVAYSIDTDGRVSAEVDGTESTGRLLSVTDGSLHASGASKPMSLSMSKPMSMSLSIELDSLTEQFEVVRDGHRAWVNCSGGQVELADVERFPAGSHEAVGAGPTAPVPGKIVVVNVAVGDRVEPGQLMVVMEAMKMEHRIEAAITAIVRELRCAVGDQVDAHQLLVLLEPVG